MRRHKSKNAAAMARGNATSTAAVEAAAVGGAANGLGQNAEPTPSSKSVAKLMEQLLGVRNDLAEERAERINVETALAKVRKKLGRSKNSHARSEEAIVDLENRYKESQNNLKKLSMQNERLQAEAEQWKTKALKLRADAKTSSEVITRDNEDLRRENTKLTRRLKKLQSELKSTRLDLKLVELNGKTWDQQLEVPGLEDAIGRGSGRGKGDADGKLEYFSSRDEQVVTKSTLFPLKPTSKVLENNAYVAAAKTREQFLEALIHRDEEALSKSITDCSRRKMFQEVKAGEVIRALLLETASDEEVRASLRDKIAFNEDELRRLRAVEMESKSLRNAATAMGMALESEQEARREVERELADAEREVARLVGELKQQEELAATNASEALEKMKVTVRKLRGEAENQRQLRKRAEKELYRSAVAITEHRTIARQLEDARSENEKLNEKLKSEGEKLQKLEKVMYRSSVVMYQQVDKRLESEQRTRTGLEAALAKEKELRLKAEAAHMRILRTLEDKQATQLEQEKDKRNELERVLAKSSSGVYRQLELRMQKEESLRNELREERERGVALERDLREARDELRMTRGTLTKTTRKLEKGAKDFGELEAEHRLRLNKRIESLNVQQQRWREEEVRLRRAVNRERDLRQKAEDATAKAMRDVEAAEMRERHAKARALAAATAASSGGPGSARAIVADMGLTTAEGEATEIEANVRLAAEGLERAHQELESKTQALRSEEMARKRADHSLKLAESLLSEKTAEAMRLRMELRKLSKGQSSTIARERAKAATAIAEIKNALRAQIKMTLQYSRDSYAGKSMVHSLCEAAEQTAVRMGDRSFRMPTGREEQLALAEKTQFKILLSQIKTDLQTKIRAIEGVREPGAGEGKEDQDEVSSELFVGNPAVDDPLMEGTASTVEAPRSTVALPSSRKTSMKKASPMEKLSPIEKRGGGGGISFDLSPGRGKGGMGVGGGRANGRDGNINGGRGGSNSDRSVSVQQMQQRLFAAQAARAAQHQADRRESAMRVINAERQMAQEQARANASMRRAQKLEKAYANLERRGGGRNKANKMFV